MEKEMRMTARQLLAYVHQALPLAYEVESLAPFLKGRDSDEKEKCDYYKSRQQRRPTRLKATMRLMRQNQETNEDGLLRPMDL